MNLTLKAILARCNFNPTEAFKYCQHMAETYPHLRAEYTGYAFHFGWSNPEVPKTITMRAEAAHV